jgi:flavodoxin
MAGPAAAEYKPNVMPKVLIVFYSRTGTTGRLAAALAQRLDADVAEIRCTRYGHGFFGFLRAAYDSLRGNMPQVETSQRVTSNYDLVLLGSPIWTSRPAVPLRAFLAGAPDLPGRIGLFLTYGGQSPETAIRETVALLQSRLEASLALKADEIQGDRLAEAVDTFLEQLGICEG